MSRALITGGAGFIGSHLAETLLGQGWTVEVIDDLSTGSLTNIAHLKGNPDFSFVQGSASNQALMTELTGRCDAVFHLAAAVGVRLIVEKPVQTMETNITTTKIALELCAEKKIPLFISSSSEVYGKHTKEKFHEDDDLVLGPTSKSRWCYAASKIIDEFLAKAYFKEKGLPVVIGRIFNTIGPRQIGQYGMVVPRFIRQALLDAPITVYGDGKQIRSFTWVKDVVNAMILLVENTSAYGEVFNIGHTEGISIYNLAEEIKKMAQSKSEITFIEYEQAYEAGFEDMLYRLPDISKIQNLINYKPSLNLSSMLTEIIAYTRQQLGMSS